MAVGKNGELYSWGEGSFQRLGLGYCPQNDNTPNQTTPYNVERVFDNPNVMALACGDQ